MVTRPTNQSARGSDLPAPLLPSFSAIVSYPSPTSLRRFKETKPRIRQKSICTSITQLKPDLVLPHSRKQCTCAHYAYKHERYRLMLGKCQRPCSICLLESQPETVYVGSGHHCARQLDGSNLGWSAANFLISSRC